MYGRMDPVSTFQSTRRAISVSWKIPAASIAEGAENMNKINENNHPLALNTLLSD